MVTEECQLSANGIQNLAYVEDDYQVHHEAESNAIGYTTSNTESPEKHVDIGRTSVSDTCSEKGQALQTKLYKRRFLMLVVFCLCSMMNAIPWIQYAVISNVTTCYFGVSEIEVSWSSLIYMVMFIPLVFPVSWVMERKSLRFTLLTGALLNLLGSVVQCVALTPDRFLVAFIAQTIFACGQVFVLSLPPYIAGAWFGSHEVSRACSFGVFGNQIGNALGFIIPPLVVSRSCDDKQGIHQGLSVMAYSMTTINAVILVALFLVFEERPPHPPSMAQAKKPKTKTKYLKSICSILKSLPFNLLLISYGLITGVYFAISTLLNELILAHFPGSAVDAGFLGALLVFAGIAGSLTFGYAMDKTHKFKEITITVFVVSFLCMLVYTALIEIQMMWLQYVMFSLLGFFMTGYIPVGFEYGAEITYPESEAMSAGLLNCSTQVFSIILTVIGTCLFKAFGCLSVDLFCCTCLLLCAITAVFIKCELKRLNQNKSENGC